GDDNKVRGELNRLREDLRRLRFKKGGILAYRDHPEIMDALNKVIAESKKIGLFFVPVGVLERRVPHLMTDVSDDMPKPERAGIMASRIRQESNKTDDVWGFVKEVYGYLR